MEKPVPDSSIVGSQTGTDLSELRAEIEILRARVAEQTAEIARLNELVETDPVTGIANRRSFDKEIARRYAEQQREGRGFGLLIIDVDRFKSINDQFGHATGDRLLQSIARVVVQNVRGTDIVARIGGDEFAIILPGSSIDQAENAARRIVQGAVPVVQAKMSDVPVGLSIGVTQSLPTSTIEQILESADLAMYRAKEKGGNRYEVGEG